MQDREGLTSTIDDFSRDVSRRSGNRVLAIFASEGLGIDHVTI